MMIMNMKDILKKKLLATMMVSMDQGYASPAPTTAYNFGISDASTNLDCCLHRFTASN